jgi:hypothetical protein
MDIRIRKAQATMWIILAIIILALIIFLLYFRSERPPEITPPGDSVNERTFMERCVEDSVNEAVSIMLPRGGFVNPENFRMYNETPVAYLCENKGYYDPCIQQHPMLIKEMEQEIDRYITPMVRDCFVELVQESADNDVEVISGVSPAEVYVNLRQDSVLIEIDKSLTFIEKDETREVKSFDFVVDNSAYNLATVALEIAAQEATYCYFEYIGFNAFYPRYKIRPFGISDSVIIYQIEDSISKQEMRIAIRSCAIPAGI